jgi:hypothetical protein
MSKNYWTFSNIFQLHHDCCWLFGELQGLHVCRQTREARTLSLGKNSQYFRWRRWGSLFPGLCMLELRSGPPQHQRKFLDACVLGWKKILAGGGGSPNVFLHLILFVLWIKTPRLFYNPFWEKSKCRRNSGHLVPWQLKQAARTNY